jgi:phage terminase large subunit
MSLDMIVPDWATPLYDPESKYRDFVFYGGRGGAKSYALVDAALVRGIAKVERIVGLRETMRSIDQSIHALMSKRIEDLNMGGYYRVMADEIRGHNGTEIFYSGLRKSASSSIKSLAAVTVGLMDEARDVSESSMKDYLPTIREKGSQRWYAFNPKDKKDSVYQRFVLNTPPDCYLKKVSWRDNPWWTNELEAERMHDQATRPWDYDYVWEGGLLAASSDSVYARQMVDAVTSGRIGTFVYDRAVPVHCAWDIGGTGDLSDANAIWFFQMIQGAIVVIDYYETISDAAFEIVDAIRAKGYSYGFQFLPHDANSHHPTSLMSVRDYVAAGNIGEAIVLARGDVRDGITNAQSKFHRAHIDKVHCELGIECLNGYTGKHDHFSHGADAWRYMMQAVDMKLSPRPRAQIAIPQQRQSSGYMPARTGRRV